jgi:hypothetical protein
LRRLTERTEELRSAWGPSGTKRRIPHGRTQGHLLLVTAPPSSNVQDSQMTLWSSLRVCIKSPLQRAFITTKELRTVDGRRSIAYKPSCASDEDRNMALSTHSELPDT